MASQRFWVWLVFWGLLAGGLLAGGAYLRQEWHTRRIQADLQLTRNLIGQKNWPDARLLLEPRMVDANRDQAWYPEAQVLFLEILIELDPVAARTQAEAILAPDAGFGAEPVARAHAFLGRTALDAQDAEGARRHFDALLAAVGPTGPGADEARLGLARVRMATAGVSQEVRDEFQALLDAFPDSPQRPEMEFALGQCNLRLLKSPVPMEGDAIYEIQKGDTLYELARKHKVSSELLTAVNGITDARMLSIGRRIKIPNLDFSIVVDKSTNTLTLLNHGQFFARYPVRTGKLDYLTPVGEFKVINKKKDPQWSDPKTHRTYAPLEPGNELGTRWIGFQGASLGIHGTIHPESIGTYASNGCVGMLKEDIEELFDLIRVGTPIRIIGQIQAQEGSPTT